jgi:hypothetical protein
LIVITSFLVPTSTIIAAVVDFVAFALPPRRLLRTGLVAVVVVVVAVVVVAAVAAVVDVVIARSSFLVTVVPTAAAAAAAVVVCVFFFILTPSIQSSLNLDNKGVSVSMTAFFRSHWSTARRTRA